MTCDCLNHCGDDPWLKDGRAQPCPQRLANLAEDKQAAERAHKVVEICNRYQPDGRWSLLDAIIMMDEKIKQLTTEQLTP